jgi:hypothetical protein
MFRALALLLGCLAFTQFSLAQSHTGVREAWFTAQLGEAINRNPRVLFVLGASVADPSKAQRYLTTQRTVKDFADFVRSAGNFGVSVPVGVEVSASGGIDVLGNGVEGKVSGGFSVDLLKAVGGAANAGVDALDNSLRELYNRHPGDFAQLTRNIYRDLSAAAAGTGTEEQEQLLSVFRTLQREDRQLQGVDASLDDLVRVLPDDPEDSYKKGLWFSLTPEQKAEIEQDRTKLFSALNPRASAQQAAQQEVIDQINKNNLVLAELAYNQEGSNATQQEILNQIKVMREVGEELLAGGRLTQARLDEINERLTTIEDEVRQVGEEIRLTRAELRQVSRDLNQLIVLSQEIGKDVKEIKAGVEFLVNDRLRQIALEQRQEDIRTARSAAMFITGVLSYVPGVNPNDAAKLNALAQNAITIYDIASAALAVGTLGPAGAFGILNATLGMLGVFGNTPQQDPVAQQILANQQKILELLQVSIDLQIATLQTVQRIGEQLARLERDENLRFNIVRDDLRNIRNNIINLTLTVTHGFAATIRQPVENEYVTYRDILTLPERQPEREVLYQRGPNSPIWNGYQRARSIIANFGSSSASRPPVLPSYGFDAAGIEAYRNDPDFSNRMSALPAMVTWLNHQIYELDARKVAQHQEALKENPALPAPQPHETFDDNIYRDLVQLDHWLTAVAWYLDLSVRLPLAGSASTEDNLLKTLCVQGCLAERAMRDLRSKAETVQKVYMEQARAFRNYLSNSIVTWATQWSTSEGLSLGYIPQTQNGVSEVLSRLNLDIGEIDDYFSLTLLSDRGGMGLLEYATEIHISRPSLLYTNEGDGAFPSSDVYYTGCLRWIYGFRWTEAAVAFNPNLRQQRIDTLSNRTMSITTETREMCFHNRPIPYARTPLPDNTVIRILSTSPTWPAELYKRYRIGCNCVTGNLPGSIVDLNPREVNTTAVTFNVLRGVLTELLSLARQDLRANFLARSATSQLFSEILDKAAFSVETAIYLSYGSCLANETSLRLILDGGEVTLKDNGQTVLLGDNVVAPGTTVAISPLLFGRDYDEVLAAIDGDTFVQDLWDFIQSLTTRTLRATSVSDAFASTPLPSIQDIETSTCTLGPIPLITGMSLLDNVASLYPDLLPSGCDLTVLAAYRGALPR